MRNLKINWRALILISITMSQLILPQDPEEGSYERLSLSEVIANNERTSQRHSVFGASVDPETDDISDIPFYPKSDEQQKKILQALEHVFLFRHLEAPIKDIVVGAFISKNVEAGEIIIERGNNGNTCYVVDSGVLEVTISCMSQEGKVKVKEYNAGYFGELTLMYDQPYGESVTAVTDGVLWVLSGFNFRRIVFFHGYQYRKKCDFLLQQVEQLKILTDSERSDVCDALQAKIYEDGQIIFNQGDKADGMYFVEDGEVSILSEDKVKKSEVELIRLSSGGYFGELALVENNPRAATAKAVGSTKLAFLEVEDFERLMGPCMDFIKKHIEGYSSDSGSGLSGLPDTKGK